MTSVSRHPDKLDVFHVSTDGFVYTAAWEQGVAENKWQGWWRVGDLRAWAGTAVAAVSRHPDKLDIFVSGADGCTYTAAWERGVADGKWEGWWNILIGRIPPGGTVSAISRYPDKLDVFHVSNDGGIYTAAWEKGDASWRGWWRIGTIETTPGSAVTVISRKM